MVEESLRQTQQTKLQQRLNPQQVQFGRLLEMSAPEIDDEIRRELDENPALEEITPDSPVDESDSFNETAEELQLADYAGDDDIPAYRLEARNHSADDDTYSPVAVSDEEESMIYTLTRQLADYSLSPLQLRVAAHIIGNLDDNGYITRSLPAIADDLAISEGIEVSDGEIKSVFDIVRGLDPAGIGAVDLRDCLLLQIARMPRSLPVNIAREIIADYFDLFSKKHFDKLRNQLGIDDEALRAGLDVIRTLNPKPGALIGSGSSSDRLRHINPDFSVDYDNETDSFTITLLSRTPELGIESTFRISDADSSKPLNQRDKEALMFIRRRHDDASLFIRMLEMRAQTLMSVMRAIVDLQHDFFADGDKASLKPMILKDIAARTGLDLSVISRATTSKYVITAFGVYPLKFFFNERLKTDNDTSSHEIAKKIASVIEAEDKSHPLSDEAIKDILAKEGYDIARRTVAKYRERMGLPVGRLRRQFPTDKK